MDKHMMMTPIHLTLKEDFKLILNNILAVLADTAVSNYAIIRKDFVGF